MKNKIKSLTKIKRSDFRNILKLHYEIRNRKNRSYSLRAFARDLGLTSSRLTEVLQGKQGLSGKWAAQIADRLQLSHEEKQEFCDLVDAQHSRSILKRNLAQERLSQFNKIVIKPLAEDAFRLIADWYHYAILELTYLKDFSSDSTWIAKKLKITKEEAEEAVMRLERLNLIIRTADGSFKPSKHMTTTTDGVSSVAIRKFHDQIIQKALWSLHNQTVEQRNITNMMFAINKEDLPWAESVIRDFRRTFSKKIESNPLKKDSVYCLAIQLIPVSE